MQSDSIIASGRTAEVLAYKPGQVIKLFREGIPADLPDEEFRVSLQIYQTGVPIPQPLNSIEYNGRKGIIYENASGITMLKAISKRPWSVGKEGERLAKLHLQLHGRTIHSLPPQKDVLKARIRSASQLASEEKERIIDHLSSLQEDTKLCHGDFHPDNIILGEREWIIDWMTGMSGNPAGDAARTILLLRFGTMPEGTPRVIENLFARIREELTKKYISHYVAAGTASFDEIEAWLLPVAAARLTEWIPEKEKEKLLALIQNRLK